MSEFNEILKITEADQVKLSEKFREKIHTHLILGHTRFVVRHSMLGEGHNRISDPMRYYSAIKEAWVRSQSMKADKAKAMIVQAELIEHDKKYNDAVECGDKVEALKQKGYRLQKQTSLESILVSCEDRSRELDELQLIIKELGPTVEAQYPGGIEEFEERHWVEIYEYEHRKAQALGKPKPDLRHIPMTDAKRMEMAEKWQAPAELASVQIRHGDKIKEIESQHTENKDRFNALKEYLKEREECPKPIPSNLETETRQ